MSNPMGLALIFECSSACVNPPSARARPAIANRLYVWIGPPYSGRMVGWGGWQATLAAEHWNAAHRYLDRGDSSAVRGFRGKSIVDVKGKRIRLLTDLEELERLGNAGVLSFESLYARAA